MKITGTQYSTVEVDVTDRKIIEAAETILRQKTGLKHGQWVDQGGVLWEEEDMGQGRSDDRVVGPATEDQVQGYRIISEMKRLYYK